jgi:hypothetical protein
VPFVIKGDVDELAFGHQKPGRVIAAQHPGLDMDRDGGCPHLYQIGIDAHDIANANVAS